MILYNIAKGVRWALYFYSLWEWFNNENFNSVELHRINNHFADVGKTIKMPKNAIKTVIDYKLTRYACYLIAMNGDSKKEVIALAQKYFAIQSRKQELSEKEYQALSETEKRLI